MENRASSVEFERNLWGANKENDQNVMNIEWKIQRVGSGSHEHFMKTHQKSVWGE